MLFYLNINIVFLIISFLILISGFYFFKISNNYSFDLNKKQKINFILVIGILIYVFFIILLSKAWYISQSTVTFHFFNDWPEWNYLDKFGHLFTAFHISDIAIRILFWIGFSRKKSLLLGALTGILFQTPIEILDGFGVAYGFSWGDMFANLCGSIFVFIQYWIWNEIRIFPKFSFHFTPYAAMRPEMLGTNYGQQFLKDYNGQTYWFAIDFFSFFKNIKLHWFIKIFCVSFGYGAEGMIHGREEQNIRDGFFPFQQYYISPDINFERIPTQNKILQILFFSINKLHALMPAIEYSSMYGLKWHFLFF